MIGITEWSLPGTNCRSGKVHIIINVEHYLIYPGKSNAEFYGITARVINHHQDELMNCKIPASIDWELEKAAGAALKVCIAFLDSCTLDRLY